MKPQIKEKWLIALKSRKYAHGNGFLKFLDSEGCLVYCAGGVLCEVHSEETGEDWGDCVLQSNVVSACAYLENRGTIPLTVIEWAGLDNLKAGYIYSRSDSADNFDSVIEYIEREL